MALAADFRFSQNTLQDWADCQRRFQLRFLDDVRWPAAETEPPVVGELAVRRGALFHRLVHQYLLGIPEQQLEAAAQRIDEMLLDPADPGVMQRWWGAFSRSRPLPAGAGVRAELTLAATVSDYRVNARYDAIYLDAEGGAFIYDWKTSRKKPGRTWLRDRLQTRVYPLLLVLAGAPLNGGRQVLPEQIHMVYWFAEEPGQPETFHYDTETMQRDQRHMEEAIAEITSVGDMEKLPLTERQERCKLCTYRSLCGRGAMAAPIEQFLDPEEELSSLEIDLATVEEIEF